MENSLQIKVLRKKREFSTKSPEGKVQNSTGIPISEFVVVEAFMLLSKKSLWKLMHN